MGTLVIINGDDDFLKERAARDEAAMSLAARFLNFRFPEMKEAYADMLDLLPLDGSQSTVIIWEATEVPDIVDECTTIIVAAKGKTLGSDRAKRILDVRKPKPYDDGADFVRWILKEGDKLNIDLRRIASALFVNCGTDLRKTCSEIAKIKVLVGPGGEAEPSMARRVMCFSAELTPRNVIDAVCEGHPAKAIAFYDRLQEGGCETGWIIAYMQRHAVTHLRAKMLIDAKCLVEQVASALGLHPTYFRNAVLPRLGLWEVLSLRQSLDTLCELDLLHKRGVDVSRWGLEIEIIRLSEEARQNVASCGSRAVQGG